MGLRGSALWLAEGAGFVSAASERSLDWRKGSTCAHGECVEVACCGSGVVVRNSAVPSVVLRFTAASWRSFVAGIALHAGSRPRQGRRQK